MSTIKKDKLMPIEYKIEGSHILELYSISQALLDPPVKVDKINGALINEAIVKDDNKTIDIRVQVIYSLPREEGNIDIFKIRTSHVFKFKSFGKWIKKDEQGNFQFSDVLLSELMEKAVSGTRGMISAVNIHPEYRKFVLPLFSHKDLVRRPSENKNNKA